MTMHDTCLGPILAGIGSIASNEDISLLAKVVNDFVWMLSKDLLVVISSANVLIARSFVNK